MSITREDVAFADLAQNREHWRRLFTERGQDDDRAADIRIALTRDGYDTMAVKEVDYLEDPAVSFGVRNQVRLRLVR